MSFTAQKVLKETPPESVAYPISVLCLLPASICFWLASNSLFQLTLMIQFQKKVPTEGQTEERAERPYLIGAFWLSLGCLTKELEYDDVADTISSLKLEEQKEVFLHQRHNLPAF